MMKKLFLLTSTVLAFLAMSCTKHTYKEKIADVIVLSRDTVVFATTGGEDVVAIASPSEWTPSCEESWVTLTPAEGQLTITADENTTTDLRTAMITIASATDTKTIAVQQAFLRDTVSLTIAAPAEISMDSEPESRFFAVQTSGEFSATDDADWLTVTTDQQAKTLDFAVTASNNTDADRTATVTVTSTLGTATQSATVTVKQICHANNPYYKMLGSFDLYADTWYLGSQSLGQGTHTSCTIVEDVYRQSFLVKDLFTPGTVITATFNQMDNSISFGLGQSCLEEEIDAFTVRYFYMVRFDKAGGSYSATLPLTGNLDDTGDKILFAPINNPEYAAFTTLGLIGQDDSMPGAMFNFGDLYYADGNNTYLLKTGTETSAAVAPQSAAQPHPYKVFSKK